MVFALLRSFPVSTSGQQNAHDVRAILGVDEAECYSLGDPSPKLLNRNVTRVGRVIQAASRIPLHSDRILTPRALDIHRMLSNIKQEPHHHPRLRSCPVHAGTAGVYVRRPLWITRSAGIAFCQLRSRSFFRARSIDSARASPPRPPLRAEASPRESHFDNLSCLVANASWVRLGCRNHHRATSGRYVGGVHQGRTFSHAANLDFEI